MNNASRINVKPDRNEPANSNWSAAQLPTLRSAEAFQKRVGYILERLNLDTWLPSSLRFKIATHCEKILNDLSSEESSLEYAKRAIEALATEVYPYDDYTLESSTLCQIRTLDLELNDLRSPEERADRPLIDFQTSISTFSSKASA